MIAIPLISLRSHHHEANDTNFLLLYFSKRASHSFHQIMPRSALLWRWHFTTGRDKLAWAGSTRICAMCMRADLDMIQGPGQGTGVYATEKASGCYLVFFFGVWFGLVGARC